jgi:hypothetical protein
MIRLEPTYCSSLQFSQPIPPDMKNDYDEVLLDTERLYFSSNLRLRCLPIVDLPYWTARCLAYSGELRHSGEHEDGSERNQHAHEVAFCTAVYLSAGFIG